MAALEHRLDAKLPAHAPQPASDGLVARAPMHSRVPDEGVGYLVECHGLADERCDAILHRSSTGIRAFRTTRGEVPRIDLPPSGEDGMAFVGIIAA